MSCVCWVRVAAAAKGQEEAFLGQGGDLGLSAGQLSLVHSYCKVAV